MTISSSAIGAYLDPNNRKDLIRVLQPSSAALWRCMSAKQVAALADRDCIYGKGSASRLKYVVLQVPPEQAQKTLEDSDLHEDRLHSSAASSTIVREQAQVIRDGRIGCFTVFSHNYGRCFNWPNYARV